MYATPLLALAFALATTAAGPGSGGGEYTRSLAAAALDQAALDAEGFGDKSVLKREADGLRVTLPQGAEETGWKPPAQLRFGGDFTISAEFVVHAIPKPATADGVAVGLAVAVGAIDQPDATFLRVVETDGTVVYRTIDKSASGATDPMQMQQQMMMMMAQNRAVIMNGMMVMGGGGIPGQPGGPKPAVPPRKTFPGSGETFRLELSREGSTLRYRVVDAQSDEPRYLGQTVLQPTDVTGVKLFVANRSGAGEVDVVLKNLSIRADRVAGLGTSVRTVFDQIVYGEPTGIEDGKLLVGGPPPTGATVPPGATSAVASPNVPPEIAARMAQAKAVVARAVPAQAVVVQAAPAQAVVVQAAPAQAVVVQAAPAQAVGRIVEGPGPVPAVHPPVADPASAPSPTDGALPADVFAPTEPVKVEPKARIPLDELEGIRFERGEAALAARFVGQPNLDFTRGAPAADQPAKPGEVVTPQKPEPADEVAEPPPGTVRVKPPPKITAEKNGIRDIQITLSGLRPAKIQQITANCQTDQGATTWILDSATGGQGWPLVLRRNGTEPTADLFLEPPPGDCHQKNFSININYEDGAGAAVSFQADGHSDPKLAVDESAVDVEPPDAWVFLMGEEKLFGKFQGVEDDAVLLVSPWKDVLKIPLSRVAGVHLSLPDRKESPESFARRLQTRRPEDLLLAQSKSGEVVTVSGVLESVKDGRVAFLYQGRSRSLALKQVEGFVLASRPAAPSDELQSTFLLAEGASISGRWKGIEAAAWKVEAPWGQELNLPTSDVQEVRFRNGKMTYLSDLEPSRVEETPFFGRRHPWRRDVSLSGGKLRMDGRLYARGLAVHSRTVLTFDLDRRYETFQTVVGFDDDVRGRGRVACRVLVDDRELYSESDLRADAPPVPLKLSVTGASQLTLIVDFGADQDVGDRVIWGDARLFRTTPPDTASLPSEPAR